MPKVVVVAFLAAIVLSACSTNRERTTLMFPECENVPAADQGKVKCINRPETPEQAAPPGLVGID